MMRARPWVTGRITRGIRPPTVPMQAGPEAIAAWIRSLLLFQKTERHQEGIQLLDGVVVGLVLLPAVIKVVALCSLLLPVVPFASARSGWRKAAPSRWTDGGS